MRIINKKPAPRFIKAKKYNYHHNSGIASEVFIITFNTNPVLFNSCTNAVLTKKLPQKIEAAMVVFINPRDAKIYLATAIFLLAIVLPSAIML